MTIANMTITVAVLLPSLATCNHDYWRLRAHTFKSVKDVAFSPDSKWLASAGDDGRVVIWDVEKRQEVWTLLPNSAFIERYDTPYGPGTSRFADPLRGNLAVFFVDFALNGRRVVAGGRDIVIYDLGSGKELRRLIPSTSLARHIAPVLSADGKLLVTVGEPQGYHSVRWTVDVWDVERLEHVATTWTYRDSYLQTLAVDGASKHVAVAIGKHIKLWRLPECRKETVLGGDGDDVRDIAFSPDGTLLASIDDAWSLRIWNVHTGNLRVAPPLDDVPNFDRAGRVFFASLTFNSDGTKLAVGLGWRIVVLDPRTGERVASVRVAADGESAYVNLVCFSLDGSKLLTTRGVFQIWDIQSGQLLARLDEAAGRWGSLVTGVADCFSPDGCYVAGRSGGPKDSPDVILWKVGNEAARSTDKDSQ